MSIVSKGDVEESSMATNSSFDDGKVIALNPRRDRAIAVTGGKGGVGKSTLAVNLAVAYADRGANTLALDADFGMADLNLLLGVAPERSLLDVINGASVEDTLVECHGISLLPALNGSYALENMPIEARQQVFRAIDSLSDRFDTLIVDVAAGVGANQTAFTGAVSDVLVVATPEPLSLADAYACLKVLSLKQGVKHAYVVPNRVRSESEASEVYSRLSSLVSRFLDMKLSRLPAIPSDPMLTQSATSGVPLVRSHPDSPAARAIRHLARRLDAIAVPDARENVAHLFWKDLLGRH